MSVATALPKGCGSSSNALAGGVSQDQDQEQEGHGHGHEHDDFLEPVDSQDTAFSPPPSAHPFYGQNTQIAARSINKIIRAIGPIVEQLVVDPHHQPQQQ